VVAEVRVDVEVQLTTLAPHTDRGRDDLAGDRRVPQRTPFVSPTGTSWTSSRASCSDLEDRVAEAMIRPAGSPY
jgi:hypothetical protein